MTTNTNPQAASKTFCEVDASELTSVEGGFMGLVIGAAFALGVVIGAALEVKVPTGTLKGLDPALKPKK